MMKNEKSIVSRGAAICPGPRTSFLDHLMPICDFFEIPLICTDPYVHFSATFFYPPHIKVLQASHENFQQVLEPFEYFFTVEPCRLHPEALLFGEFLYRGKAKTIAGFHGNSDKFRNRFWIERYADEDALLLYGRHSFDFLKEKKVEERIKNYTFIGNLRLLFYKKYQSFFDRFVVKGPPDRKTLLYAPSWAYPGEEESSTFFDQHIFILDKIPHDFRVVIKLHPYLFRLYPDLVAFIKAKYEAYREIVFLEETPLVYPWLFASDIYLGDYSSVSYDFLSVNKPLFFLVEHQNQFHGGGTIISNLAALYETIRQEDTLGPQRKALYEYSFEPNISLENIKMAVERMLL